MTVMDNQTSVFFFNPQIHNGFPLLYKDIHTWEERPQKDILNRPICIFLKSFDQFHLTLFNVGCMSTIYLKPPPNFTKQLGSEIRR